MPIRSLPLNIVLKGLIQEQCNVKVYRATQINVSNPFKVLIVMKTADDYFVNVKINEGFFFHLFFVLTFCNISAIFVLTFL